MQQLMAWLRASMPRDGGAALVHGDFRLDNLMFDAETDQVLAVLDWELSTIGNPLADLAYNCMAYHLPSELNAAFQGFAGLDLAALGIPSEQQYLAAYCRRTGRPSPPANWHFYLVRSRCRHCSSCVLLQVASLMGALGHRPSPCSAAQPFCRASTSAPSRAMLAVRVPRWLEPWPLVWPKLPGSWYSNSSSNRQLAHSVHRRLRRLSCRRPCSTARTTPSTTCRTRCISLSAPSTYAERLSTSSAPRCCQPSRSSSSRSTPPDRRGSTRRSSTSSRHKPRFVRLPAAAPALRATHRSAGSGVVEHVPAQGSARGTAALERRVRHDRRA